MRVRSPGSSWSRYIEHDRDHAKREAVVSVISSRVGCFPACVGLFQEGEQPCQEISWTWRGACQGQKATEAKWPRRCSLFGIIFTLGSLPTPPSSPHPRHQEFTRSVQVRSENGPPGENLLTAFFGEHPPRIDRLLGVEIND